MSFETAHQLWREGTRFVASVPDGERDVVLRVEAQIFAELRRRLGSTFTTDELVELYEQGTGWCLDLAARVAPASPDSWDARIADSAFARYVHDAVDYAGGRRLDP
jgi:hypothetical protein